MFDNSLKLNIPGGDTATSIRFNNLEIPNSREYFFVAKVKKPNSNLAGAARIKLRQDSGSIEKEILFSAGDKQLKFNKFTLTSETYSFFVDVENQSSEDLEVEVWLCVHNKNQEREVVNVNNGNPQLIQYLFFS